MTILGDVTPLVERISIDEAFLDVTGATHLFGPPTAIAVALRARVRDDVGLPISVGAARTKHLAKVASQVAKPDGLVVVEPDREREFLHPLPVDLMWGVGPVTRQRLAERGIKTIGDLAATPSAALVYLLGDAAGTRLGALAVNDDPRRLARSGRARSVGAQSALGRCRPTRELVREVLAHLADRVTGRLRAKHRAARTVGVRVRFAGLRSVTRSHTLSGPIAATLTVTEIAEELVWHAIDDHGDGPQEISLLAISMSNLVGAHGLQSELALDPDDPHRPGSVAGAARWAVDVSVDAIRAKFGRNSVGYLPALARSRGVPDEFRELAEREL
jgi:DNA polymerase-4